MQDKTIKLGIVGAGRGTDVGRCGVGMPNLEIRAVCDKKPDRLEAGKKKLIDAGVKEENLLVFSDYGEMLRSDIDAVLVATDAIYHVPVVLPALEAGKHVLSEIPTINSLEEAKILRKAVKAHPELIYMAGENCFFWAFIDAWKKMHDDGKFGEVIYAESEYLHSRDHQEMKPEDYPKDHWRSFNPPIKYLTHNLGPLLYILKDKCVKVSCMTPDAKYNPYHDKPRNQVALFKTEKGAVIRIFVGFDGYMGMDHNFCIKGTRGSIETDKIASLSEAHSFAQLSDVPGTFYHKLEIPVTLAYPGEGTKGHGGADMKMLKEFISCILEGRQSFLDVDMGIRISLPGIFAAESADQGGKLVDIINPEDFD